MTDRDDDEPLREWPSLDSPLTWLVGALAATGAAALSAFWPAWW